MKRMQKGPVVVTGPFGAHGVDSAAPGADRAAIHVDEVGAGIFADAATAAGHARAVDLADRPAAETQIGGFADDVAGILCDAARARAQHGVGLGAAVAAEQGVGFARIEQVVAGGHDVDGADVDGFHVIGAPVAHEERDFPDRIADIFALDPVDRVDPFAGAGRNHAQAADVDTIYWIEGEYIR